MSLNLAVHSYFLLLTVFLLEHYAVYTPQGLTLIAYHYEHILLFF